MSNKFPEQAEPFSKEHYKAAASTLGKLSDQLNQTRNAGDAAAMTVDMRTSPERATMRANRKNISEAIELREILDNTLAIFSRMHKSNITPDAQQLRDKLTEHAQNGAYNANAYAATGLKNISDESLLRLYNPETRADEKAEILRTHDAHISGSLSSPYSEFLAEAIQPRVNRLVEHANDTLRGQDIKGWSK